MSNSAFTSGYALVNGLRLYHEIHGSGRPLVLVHGGGSTIESTFGRILPAFAERHRVVAVELQAHGHTPDIDRPLSFEQDADDLDALLEGLGIAEADFLGFSNGGTTCLQVAIRHPRRVEKLVLASATFRRDGLMPDLFEGFKDVTLASMPAPLTAAYLKANPDPRGLEAMFRRDVARMSGFTDISSELIRSITAPSLVLNADEDVVLPEHALALARTLPHGQLAILPGRHGEYLGEICSRNVQSRIPNLVVAMIEEFLAAAAQ